ncbi:unnamed protein product [Leuciscus chuanchicus]
MLIGSRLQDADQSERTWVSPSNSCCPSERVNGEKEETESNGFRCDVLVWFSALRWTSLRCTGELSFISCSPGESVMLPCSDENSQHKDIKWRHSEIWETRNPADVITDQRYKGRVQIHGNLSLSITHLTIDDSRSYWCNFKEPVNLIIEGCSISGSETSEAISRYPGESVFLSCSVKCSARFKPDKFIWKLPNYREINQTTNSNELNRLFQGRIHMFDTHSGNFSLLISNLTEKDEGLYVCWINENQHKSFSLTTEREPKTKYPGDSVLLSCSYSNGTELSNETLRNRARFHTFHNTTPSNLSLLISNLTEDDNGTYRCTINDKTSTYTSLKVTGCVLSEHHISKISYAGETVTLPCSCEDPKTKPKHVEWKRAALNETLVSYAKDVNGRFQILRDSPHNLSLRISNLTEADGGLYACMVNGKQSRSINLTVTAKKRRTESRVTQSPDHQDDVTYSTVMQINRGKPAENQQQEEVVYSTMADVRNGRSAQGDVTYSSVISSQSHTPRSVQINPEEDTVYASVQKDQT